MLRTSIISRAEAIKWLNKPKKRTLLGRVIKGRRHPRGAGAAVDLINYGLLAHNGSIRAVMRIGNAPFGGNPVKAAIGKENAVHTAYIMRLMGQGIKADELQSFVETCLDRFRSDMKRSFRYLFSLDDPEDYLIEGHQVWADKGYTGEIYAKCGALSAGYSNTRGSVTQFIDLEGNLRSIYRNGRNLYHHELPPGSRLVKANAKHRFVFILAANKLEYQAFRRALPANVVEMAERFTQPRLLRRKNERLMRPMWPNLGKEPHFGGRMPGLPG